MRGFGSQRAAGSWPGGRFGMTAVKQPKTGIGTARSTCDDPARGLIVTVLMRPAGRHTSSKFYTREDTGVRQPVGHFISSRR